MWRDLNRDLDFRFDELCFVQIWPSRLAGCWISRINPFFFILYDYTLCFRVLYVSSETFSQPHPGNRFCWWVKFSEWMNEWMNENFYIEHKKFHTKECMFTVPGAHGCSRKLKIEGKICTKIKPTDGLPENQDEDISIHNIHTTMGGGGPLLEFNSS